MKAHIELVTLSDCQKLANYCSKLDGQIELFSPRERFRCNAKSLIGCLSAIEWNDLWIECNEDVEDELLSGIATFLVDEDGAFVHD